MAAAPRSRICIVVQYIVVLLLLQSPQSQSIKGLPAAENALKLHESLASRVDKVERSFCFRLQLHVLQGMVRTKPKRTHARLTCQTCKERKRRCELPDTHYAEAEADRTQALPPSKACHRCCTLQIDCFLRSNSVHGSCSPPSTSSRRVPNSFTISSLLGAQSRSNDGRSGVSDANAHEPRRPSAPMISTPNPEPIPDTFVDAARRSRSREGPAGVTHQQGDESNGQEPDSSDAMVILLRNTSASTSSLSHDLMGHPYATLNWLLHARRFALTSGVAVIPRERGELGNILEVIDEELVRRLETRCVVSTVCGFLYCF